MELHASCGVKSAASSVELRFCAHFNSLSKKFPQLCGTQRNNRKKLRFLYENDVAGELWELFLLFHNYDKQ